MDKTVAKQKRNSKKNKCIKIWQETGGYCVFCGSGDTKKKRTVDHIIPKSQGGSNSCENLAPACKGCNNKRGIHFPPSELAHPSFFDYLKSKEEKLKDPIRKIIYPAIKEIGDIQNLIPMQLFYRLRNYELSKPKKA